MKAAVHRRYGPPEVVRVEEVREPKPKADEILVEVHATTVTAGDVRLRASDFPSGYWLMARLMFGLFKPKKTILGHEFSGTVKKVGKRVKHFQVEDQVFGTTTMLKAGAHAEYVCIPEKWKNGVLLHKPAKLNHRQSAALPIGGMTALYLMEKARLKSGQEVLVHGASGSVGSYAIQIAKILGARVTAVCSGSNKEMVLQLGADEVIDYQTEDYSKRKRSFDLVFDAVGKTTKAEAKRTLKRRGSFVSITMMTKKKTEHLEQLKNWANEGLIKAFIDHTYALDEIVAAHHHVDSGRKRGNLVIEIRPESHDKLKHMEEEKEQDEPIENALLGIYESEVTYSDGKIPPEAKYRIEV